MSAANVVPLVIAAIVVATDFWVYGDAKRQLQRGTPVEFRAGSIAMDTPAMWAIGCLVLWIFFFPLYLTSRQ